MSAGRHRVPGGGLVVALAALLALVTVACGIPTDDEPRPLADETVSSTTSEPAREGGGTAATVYLVSNDRLVDSTRAIEGPRTPEAVVTALLLPTTEAEQRDGLQTFVPQGTTASSVVDEGDGIWTVDLSDEWGGLVDPAALYAYGQVVLTLTALPDVDAVRFRIDGMSVDAVPTVNQEASATVEAGDYAELRTDR